MMRSQSRWVVTAAVAAVCFGIVQSSAVAQYQTDNNTGRALDANNRMGSGGTNEARPQSGVTPNDIVWGTVTGGRQFRGPHTAQPQEFRGGGTAGPSDNIVRATGVGVYERSYDYDPTQSRRVWTDRLAVNPPANYEQLQTGSVATFVVKPPVYRVPGDIRMDATIPNPDLGLTSPSQYILPGLTPMSDDIFASALPQAIAGQAQPGELPSLLPSSDLLRRLNLSESQIKDMQAEVQRTEAANPNDLTLAPETPANDAMTSGVNNSIENQAFGASVNTDQALRQRLLTSAPQNARADSQYAMLQNRLARFRKGQTVNDQEANQQFLEEWQQAQQKAKETDETKRRSEVPAQPEEVVKKAIPLDKPREGNEAAPANSASRANEARTRMALKMQNEPGGTKIIGDTPRSDLPVRITSFADGVKATGLKNLLSDAEKAMQSGKFTQALDYYDAANAVAPDNSMVLMGRAVAELGAGYYARSQMHLEQILSADPALLMARYDLKAFYGDDRLQYIVRDLKDLAQTESQQARPLFLLAFVAYNSDNPERSADYLNMAQQRGGSKQFYDQLREYWKLNNKEKGAEPAGNK